MLLQRPDLDVNAVDAKGWVQGLGFRVSGFRVEGLGRRGLRVEGLGFTWTPKNLPFVGFLVMFSLYRSLKKQVT